MSPGWKRAFSLLLSLAVASVWAGTAHSQERRAWTATYDGPGTQDDTPSALAVDRDGNVLVTGFSSFGSSLKPSQFATVKYSPDGRALWGASYLGSLRNCKARALAVDSTGNVFVTGSIEGLSTEDSDYATVKYSPGGKELWVQLYDGADGTSDIPRAIAVDAGGNVVVTGESFGGAAAGSDYATVKYSPEGNELWVQRYAGPAGNDRPGGIAVDAGGDILVTGASYGGFSAGMDYATVKYSPDGKELWVQRWNGPASGLDEASDIALDSTGNVYVTGGSAAVASGDSDYATVKYAPGGTELWVERWSGPGELSDVPRGIAVDAGGNIIVTGESLRVDGKGLDYATVKYSPDGKEIWAQRYNGPGDKSDRPNGTAVDAVGNVYVTGDSYGGTGTSSDFATVKYSPEGEELWVERWNGAGSQVDIPCGIALDAGSNVLVSGQSKDLRTSRDFATLKLDPDGKVLWVQAHSGPGSQDEEAVALALDGDGNVLVTGESLGPVTGFDYATVKYATDGSEIWARRWGGQGSGNDNPAGMAVDAGGNVLVTGESVGDAATGSDYATIKYGPDGTELWVQRYNGPDGGDDIPKSVATDGAGNVLVTGESGGEPETNLDFATIKYAPDGREIWVRRYDGAPSGPDRPCGIAVNAAGDVHVAGESPGGSVTDPDYATVKYAPDGTELWARRWSGTGSLGDIPRGIAVDAAGNVLVTGESHAAGGTGWDYATVKYAPDGTELWVRMYNGPQDEVDRPVAMAVDATGNVHVTGMSLGVGEGTDWATVKYDAEGDELWVQRLPTQGTGGSGPKAMTLDGAGNVLVAGGPTSFFMTVFVKYDPHGKRLWDQWQGASVAAIATDDQGGIYVTGRLNADYVTCKYESVPLKRGAIDADDKMDITDAIVLLQHLFLGGDAPPCLDAADLDDNGELSLPDPIRLLSYLFLGGVAPEEPFDHCGRDTTLDSIECNVQPSCDPFGGIRPFTFYGQEFQADGVFYVVDTSGSMEDSGELAIVKREILRTMGEFPESVEFGIVFFDSSAVAFPESGLPAKASLEMKAGATGFVQSVEGGYGSCCQQGIAAGLQLANQSTAKRKVLLFVTDGGGTCQGADEATYLRQTLDAITAMNDHGVQIDCIGVLSPSALGAAFMKNLAEANGGTYTRVVHR